MHFAEVFVRRPVMAIALNLVVLILGIVAFNQLELRHVPNQAKNELTITTIYPGANMYAVEHQVTKPLEDAMAGIDGIKNLNSHTFDGRSEIHVIFKMGVNNQKALSQVRDRALSTILPDAVKRPEIQEKSENDSAIMWLNFEDKTRSIPALSDYIQRYVEEPLKLVDGVASVSSFGNRAYRIAIKPDPALLMEHQVSITEVVEVLRREKTFASGGEIEGISGRQAVVLSAMVEKPEDFANVTLKLKPSGRVTIGNVASIEISEKPTFLRMWVNGQERVGIQILPKPSANPLEVAQSVKVFIQDLQRKMPPTMKAEIIFDATRPFAAAFVEIRHTLWEAIALVGIIMALSLASIRAALLPMITVPLCLVGSFALMLAAGFSINPVTLLALVLAVGLVVDDAIVVVENVYKHMEAGCTAFEAAKRGMKEISFAVVVMTVTLAAVYLPLVFQTDESALMFREFAWTLAGSVLISGFVALTLTPALCGQYLKGHKKVLFWERLSEKYRVYLEIALRHPGKISLMLVLIAALGVMGFEKLPSELIPIEDEGQIQGFLLAEGSVTESVREAWFQKLDTLLKEEVPEQQDIGIGIWQDQYMWWNLLLKPTADRSRTVKEIIQALRPRLQTFVGPMVMVNDTNGFGRDNDPFKIVLQYAGDPKTLISAVQNIMREAGKLPGFAGLNSDQSSEKARLNVVVDRGLAAELGVGINAIEDTLYTFLTGRKAADYNFQGIDYDVYVRAPREYRSEFQDLNAFFVAGGSTQNQETQWVPLGSLVSLKEVLEPGEIKHEDRVRGASIQVNLQPDMALDKAMQVLEPVIRKHLPKGATFRFGGKAEQYKESRVAMLLTFALAMAFIYLVLAALFESFIHPFVVLLTVPLSITGAVWAVYFSGGTNNLYTSIGLVTLIGLITKHGILIVDFSNRLRAEGQALKEAVLAAAASRLRPVLMTTFAMVAGAIPLLSSMGAGAIARADIGWVIIGGMLLGTVFSLFVVPVAYVLVSRSRRLI